MARKPWIWIFSFMGIAIVIVILNLWNPKQSNADKVYRMGVVTSLTGPVAPYGQSVLNGINVAVGVINAGPFPHIEIIVEDDASSTQNAVTSFTKLVDVNHVPVVIGPVGSSQAMVCSPIANSKRVVLFSPAASTPDFSSPDDYTFRNRPSADLEVNEMARIAAKTLDYRKGAVIYVNNDFGAGNRKAFIKAFRSYGGEIVAEEAFEQGATDIRAQLIKLAAAKPDFIYLLGQVVESGYVLKQAREFNIQIPFLSHTSIQGDDVLRIAGKAADGVIYTTTTYNPESGDTIAKEFETRYQKSYSRKGDMFAANGFDAIFIVRSAIIKGGYDADGIKNALYEIKDYHGAAGLISFDRNGDVQRPVTLKRISNGQFETIMEADLRHGR